MTIEIQDFDDGKVPPMPLDYQLCGCGSCKDAFDVALKNVEKNLINDCAMWSTAVALMQINILMTMANSTEERDHEGAKSAFSLTTLETAVWAKQHRSHYVPLIEDMLKRVMAAKHM
jgi:hypothetical protein